MRHLLLTMAIVLTATMNVSAQQIPQRSSFETTTRTTIYLDPSAPVAKKETISFPYVEITEIRLWAPSKKTGKYGWWKLTREHRGPIYERFGETWTKTTDDLLIEKWVPGDAPPQTLAEERQRSNVIQHSTKCWWPEEDLKEEKQEPRPKQLVEPVYRVPKQQAEEQGDKWRPLEVKPPLTSPERTPEWKPAPQEELDEPSGPTFLVKRSPGK